MLLFCFLKYLIINTSLNILNQPATKIYYSTTGPIKKQTKKQQQKQPHW